MMQNVIQGEQNKVHKSGEECNSETHRQRLPNDNTIRRELEGLGGAKLLHPSRQQCQLKGKSDLPTMISPYVEISITRLGGVGEKIRVISFLLPRPFS